MGYTTDLFSVYRGPGRMASKATARSIGRSISTSSSPSVNQKSWIGVPEALLFEKVINGCTVPPCTCRDFMSYLTYVEHSAETLQFYLWYLDYNKRFRQLPCSEKSLSPEWRYPHNCNNVPESSNAVSLNDIGLWRVKDNTSTEHLFDSAFNAGVVAQEVEKSYHADTYTHGHEGLGLRVPDITFGKEGSGKYSESSSVRVFQYDHERGEEIQIENEMGDIGLTSPAMTSEEFSYINHEEVTAKAFEEIGDTKWMPFTIQPFRHEISRIITLYLASNSPRELNLSSRDRTLALQALRHTTHPSALAFIKDNVESTLRLQSHPNFIRWSICNGNAPRLQFGRTLGIMTTLTGVVVAVALTLGSAERWWRLMAATLWIGGIAFAVAGRNGLCIILHLTHRRHLRPWELWVESDEELKAWEVNRESVDSSGGSSNSYEDEPWVAKYRKRSTLRKIFDKEVWIEEPAIRHLQDRIVVRAVLIAAAVTIILSACFVALPKGNLY